MKASSKGIYLGRSGKRNVALGILVLVTILIVFATLEPIFYPFSNNQRYSDLGILGPNQTIGDYPTSVVANQSFPLSAYLFNAEGSAQYYNILVKIGNQSTLISNSTSANVPVIASYYAVVDTNQSTILPLQLSITHPGIRERLIFELWAFEHSSSGFTPTYTGVWDAIWLNVTV